MTLSRKPLVLRAVSRMALGGVQRGILSTLARADRERFDLAVLCTKKEGHWAADLRAMGVPVYLQKTIPPWHPVKIWRLARRIRKINPDIVHIHMAPMVVPVASAAWLAGVRRVVIQHHSNYARHWAEAGPILRGWEWALTRRAGALIAVSEPVARESAARIGLAPERVFTIPNGIEVERFAEAEPYDPRPEWGLAPGTPLVVHVARYLNTKRIEDFIEAGALVGRRWAGPGPAPAFVAIGGGAQEYEALYQKRIYELGAGVWVRLAGSRGDVPAILKTAQVGVLASENEGFGQVVLEYLAAGLPVAATDLPSILEMVREGEEALLSPPRQPERLAENIERLLRDGELAGRLVEQGRRRLERFSWAAAVRGYEAIYEQLLAER